MYDTFSTDYDRFVDWPSRLAYELPFIEQQLQTLIPGNNKPLHILDSACGTGMHAIALARLGYSVAGADLSAKMIEQAHHNAADAGVEAQFTTAGFGDLQKAFQNETAYPFDALLCLGNSLPHILSPKQLAAALADFAACLRPGGLLLVQNRNFDAVMQERGRWMGPQSHKEGTREWLFVRFYDFEKDGTITFNIMTLQRKDDEDWQQQIITTHLYPLQQENLTAALSAAGFEQIICYGDMEGKAFDPVSSGNLVVTARKRSIKR